MTRERRVRCYHVPEEAAWHLLRPRWLLPGVASFHFFDGVPDDVTVEGVWHDPQRSAFTFVLSHPSFEAVPAGEMAPSGGQGSWETVGVRRRPDGEALAYEALREENRTMRLILGDMIADEDRIRAAYELGRRDFEREAVEALAPLAEVLDGDAARIDWHAVRARMKSPVKTLHELLGRMSLTRKPCDEPPTPPQVGPDWLGGVVPWALPFVPGVILQPGDPVTLGADGLWRPTGPGEIVMGYVQYDALGVARVRAPWW